MVQLNPVQPLYSSPDFIQGGYPDECSNYAVRHQYNRICKRSATLGSYNYSQCSTENTTGWRRSDSTHRSSSRYSPRPSVRKLREAAKPGIQPSRGLLSSVLILFVFSAVLEFKKLDLGREQKPRRCRPDIFLSSCRSETGTKVPSLEGLVNFAISRRLLLAAST